MFVRRFVFNDAALVN